MSAEAELLSEVIAGRSWREDAEAFSESMGVTVAVLRAGRRTEPSHVRCPVCLLAAPASGDDSVPSLACFDVGTFAHRSDEVATRCVSGMPCALRRVGDGEPLGYVMVAGYVSTDTQRKDLLTRLLAHGLPERHARAVTRRTPVLAERAAMAGARLAASHLEALVRAAGPGGPDAERLVRLERLYEIGAVFESRLGDVETLPQPILERALSLSRADAGSVYLLDADGVTLVRVAQTGETPSLTQARCPVGGGAPGRAAAKGGAVLENGPGEHRTLAVPLCHEGELVGAVAVVEPEGPVFEDQDLRLMELFASSAAQAFVNARLFSEANERVVELMQLNELSKALLADAELDRITYLVTGVLDKLIGFEVGGLVLLGREERGRVVVHEDLAEADLTALLGEVTGMELGTSFLQRCIFVPAGGHVLESSDGPGAKWTVLTADVSTIRPEAGYLFAASRDPNAFDAKDMRLLQAEAGHASAALEKSRVYARLRADLTKVVGALSAMLDATERCGKGHADRVMDHAVAIGEELGLPIEALETLRFAGLLHDIGKLGVSEDIILKPSRLTEEEMAQVRRHSEIGATLVDQMDFLGDLAPVILHHHERWDGKGYPRQLMAEEIPLLSRILAVADAYDAMTCDRVYTKALPPATARIELERGAGRQFDPCVVEAFLAVLDRSASSAATGLFASNGDGRPQLPA